MKPTVVLLLSDKRSGSTMFQDELCKHPDIQHVAYSPHTYYETHHFLKAANILKIPENEYCGGQVYKGYGSIQNAKSYLVDCVRGNVPEFEIPKNLHALVFEGWEALCHKYASPVFFEKSPQYLAHWATLSLILEWMEKTEYRVKIIGLVRNPMSVFYSAWKLFKTLPEKRQYGWGTIYRNLLAFKAFVPPEDFLMVRYEDMIHSPESQFRQICEFIGLDYHEDVGASVHQGSLNKWRDDPEFTVQYHPNIQRVAKHFGYIGDDLFNPEKPGMPVLKKMIWDLEKILKLSKANIYNRFLNPLLMRTIKKK